MDKENVVIAVRMSKEDKQALLMYGKEHDLNISQIIRRAIKEFLEK